MNRLMVVLGVGLVSALTTVAGEIADVTGRMEFFGNPNATWWVNDTSPREMKDLKSYQGRLYLTGGDWGKNAGACAVFSMDPFTCAFTNEYASRAEGLAWYRVLPDGSLVVSDSDNCDSWTAFFYRKDPVTGAWKKKSIVGDCPHTFDIVPLGTALVACGEGSIATSTNGFATSTDNGVWQRTFSLLPFKDCAYAITRGCKWHPYEEAAFGDAVTTQKAIRMVYKIDASTLAMTTKFGLTIPDCFDSSYDSAADRELQSADADLDVMLWHTTPISGDRVLAIVGGERASDILPYGLAVFRPSGDRFYAKRVRSIPSGVHPWDLMEYGGKIYCVVSSYDATNKKIVNGVWVSSDGETFAQLFTFSAPGIARCLEYIDGKFYFSFANRSGFKYPTVTGDGYLVGDVYRVDWALEPRRRPWPRLRRFPSPKVRLRTLDSGSPRLRRRT